MCPVKGNRAGEGAGAAGRAQPGEKGAQREALLAVHNSLTGRCSPGGGRALLPGSKGQDERKWPQGVAGEV